MAEKGYYYAIANTWHSLNQSYDDWLDYINKYLKDLYQDKKIDNELLIAKKMEMVLNQIRGIKGKIEINQESNTDQETISLAEKEIFDNYIEYVQQNFSKIYEILYGVKNATPQQILGLTNTQNRSYIGRLAPSSAKNNPNLGSSNIKKGTNIFETGITTILVALIRKAVDDIQIQKGEAILSNNTLQKLGEKILLGNNYTSVLGQISKNLSKDLREVGEGVAKKVGSFNNRIGEVQPVQQKIDAGVDKINWELDLGVPSFNEAITSLKSILGPLSEATYSIKNYEFSQSRINSSSIKIFGSYKSDTLSLGNTKTDSKIIGTSQTILSEKLHVSYIRLAPRWHKGDSSQRISVGESFYIRGLLFLEGHTPEDIFFEDKPPERNSIEEVWDKLELLYEISGFGQIMGTANYLIVSAADSSNALSGAAGIRVMSIKGILNGRYGENSLSRYSKTNIGIQLSNLFKIK